MASNNLDIILALAQGRQLNFNGIQAKQQILAKLFFVMQLRLGSVGGGDHANIDINNSV